MTRPYQKQRNALCDQCKQFRPYCLEVYLRPNGKRDRHRSVVCLPCRKAARLRRSK